ncbi:hypothetical protein M2152_002323 [Microbacteriaceae bacterium SG_E_30_P1]|uniref:Uncharacterized protein n=1 Tax=Antiquaquibacter oligotrophicus TaxID=2880260 RepID=A0ABT6KQQ2_9MICO|nr:hypothetical protein [Antiquaquibacter oligotrophicus]MDH6182141.1 hypothetical protein [Antiquaquibacter oligotrophicus]UDF12196.1 hypothetical protein LH407_08455 [Antiquaquibacter oligotrophicus]
MDGLVAHLRREVPIHALMICVMAVSMVSRSAPASMAGAILLIVVSIVCASYSRTHRFLRAHMLDLWAMALVMIAAVPRDTVAGHHSMVLPSVASFVIVIAAWGLARVALAARARGWVADAASAAITGAGLLVMAVFCG